MLFYVEIYIHSIIICDINYAFLTWTASITSFNIYFLLNSLFLGYNLNKVFYIFVLQLFVRKWTILFGHTVCIPNWSILTKSKLCCAQNIMLTKFNILNYSKYFMKEWVRKLILQMLSGHTKHYILSKNLVKFSQYMNIY